MSIHWFGAPLVRFATWPEPGTIHKGELVAYQQHGAQNRDRTKEVGCVVLGQDDGSWLKVALDKAQLATVVDNAVIAIRYRQANGDWGTPHLAIIYRGDSDKGYKIFEAKGGFEDERTTQ